MNCHQFRKYLFAFADGQIDVKSNCDLLDHLKLCPDCARIVDQHQSLKSFVVASAARISLPAGLEGRIRKAVSAASPKPSASRRAGKHPVLRVTALAACLALGFFGLWMTGVIQPGDFLRGGGELVAFADGLAEQITQGIVVQHNKCVETCNEQGHHLPSLPTDRMDAAETLQRDLGDRFAVAAPDLSGFGFEFESAGVCPPNRNVHGPAAHVMYVNPAFGTRLSFFSVPHWSGADEILTGTSVRRPFSHTLGNCENQSVIAWNGATTTYIVAGPINEDDLAAMIREAAFSLPADAVAGLDGR